MKKYLVVGLATAGLVLAASGSAWAGSGASAGFNLLGIQAVSNSELSNNSAQAAIATGNALGGNQGIQYGNRTFQNMGGVNSNGVGTNAGTGQSQVSVTAAGVVNIVNP